jgi:hypothetical protein
VDWKFAIAIGRLWISPGKLPWWSRPSAPLHPLSTTVPLQPSFGRATYPLRQPGARSWDCKRAVQRDIHREGSGASGTAGTEGRAFFLFFFLPCKLARRDFVRGLLPPGFSVVLNSSLLEELTLREPRFELRDRCAEPLFRLALGFSSRPRIAKLAGGVERGADVP